MTTARTIRALTLALCACALVPACSSTQETAAPRDAAPATGAGRVYNCAALNSSEDDFAPALTADGRRVYFTSNRPLQAGERKLSPEFLYGERVYEAVSVAADPAGAADPRLDDAARWPASARRPVPALDQPNSGTATIDSAGMPQVFSASYRTGPGGSDLYSLAGGSAAAVAGVNSSWWDAHPALSRKGDLLVFASDRVATEPSVRDSGRRTPHLWIAERSADGGWGSPRALPPPIQSLAAEISPFFDGDSVLYFSSNRRGSFDIARSELRRDGSWSEPEFLPEPVNSSANEYFPFLLADRTRMLFASDRSGGAGGIDLYCAEMPYCITLVTEVRLEFGGPGGATLHEAGADLGLLVRDAATQAVVAQGRTDTAGRWVTSCLPAGRVLTIEAEHPGCFQAALPVTARTPVPRGFRDTVRATLALTRAELQRYEPRNDSIPFFVTGYWYPNTQENLRLLRIRKAAGELPNAHFIDTLDYNYDSVSVRVTRWFEDSLYAPLEREVLSMVDRCYGSGDTVVIDVHGYVDPLRLRWGLYEETQAVSTEDMTVKPGSVMVGEDGNLKLSHLRAWYTMRMIDEEMAARSAGYKRLRDTGRIRLRCTGKFIGSDQQGDAVQGYQADPFKRKILVSIEVKRGR